MSSKRQDPPSPDALAARARGVAEQDLRLREALAGEGAARLELLERVLAAVAPALPALSGRIVASATVRVGTDRKESDEVRSFLELAGVQVRGVHVAGDISPRRDLPSAESGLFRGGSVWLLEDGRFVELAFAGRWSKTGPEASSWTVTAREMPAAEVAREFLDEVLAKLATALEKQNPEGRAAAAAARTARLRAILTLLGDLR